VYRVEELPPHYWKQYNDAGRVLEQIKQKAPKVHLITLLVTWVTLTWSVLQLVLYNAKAKCTLMSNIPQGDIEIVYPSCSASLHKKRHRQAESVIKGEPYSPTMRVRFCRQRQTVEIARFVHAPGGGEWTKHFLKTVDGSLGNTDWHSLQIAEKTAMDDLHEFVRVCEAVEKVEDGSPWSEQTLRRDTVTPEPVGRRTKSGFRSTSSSLACDTNRSPQARSQPDSDQGASWRASSAATDGLSVCHIALRPKKLSSLVSKSMAANCIGNEGNQATSMDFDITPQQHITDVTNEKRWSRGECSDQILATGVQTRFIPSVGWCIRHGSRVSQGGRYRVMFLDGAALDVDVDEEYVEFTGQAGDITRLVDHK
jgi:polo-like kinase 4